MTVNEIAQILNATFYTGQNRGDQIVQSACGADLMSDVMAFVKEDVVLLTGLLNIQTVRTANLLDIEVIVFVRGKTPSPEMIALAQEEDIILLSTRESLFLSCGRLYEAGLRRGGTRIID